MKTGLRLIFLLLAGFAAASCEKIDNGPEIGGPDPVEDPTLHLWSGEDTLLHVAGDMSAYSVSSELEEVAIAELTADGILITAGRYGNTAVHIDSEADRRVTVSVRSMLLTGDWENLAGDETYKNSVTVEAEDAAFAEELKEQLKEELQEETADLIGYSFRPYASAVGIDSLIFLKFIHSTPLHEPPLKPASRGTYSFGALSLTLNPAGGEKEVYHLLPYPDRLIIGLQQDLTRRYQERYPDKGVQKVTLTRHLKQRLPPG